MTNKVLIKEIFESIQGEGLYLGVNQLFIRFSKCNLDCLYCDTDFKTDLKEYSVKELAEEVNKYSNIHSLSLTGAEPLCEVDFLMEFLPIINKKIYLETNGVLFENLEKIINNTDIISMDIKLPSCTKMKDFFYEHELFIQTALRNNKEIFLKTVFDEKITKKEILKTALLANKYDLILILQPKMNNGTLNLTTEFINKIYCEFLKNCQNVRLIPQVHKFLNIK